MKFFQTRRFVAVVLFAFLHLAGLYAQSPAAEPMQDFMRQTGKINVVVAVIVVIFIGIVVWMWRMDRNLSRLEHQIFNDNE